MRLTEERLKEIRKDAKRRYIPEDLSGAETVSMVEEILLSRQRTQLEREVIEAAKKFYEAMCDGVLSSPGALFVALNALKAHEKENAG